MSQKVAVVDTRASALASHLVAEPRLDERVHHDGRTAAGSGDGQREVLDRLDPRVPHLVEQQVGKLRLEREDETRGGLPRRVGHDVELDGNLVAHGPEPNGGRSAPRAPP